MNLLLAVAVLQTISATPERIDLTVPQPCEHARAGEEVVVCANRSGENPYRLKQPAQKERGPAKAQVQVADGVTAGAETENVDVGGFPSNRFMLRLKMKF
jgi:hypothetical protein